MKSVSTVKAMHAFADTKVQELKFKLSNILRDTEDLPAVRIFKALEVCERVESEGAEFPPRAPASPTGERPPTFKHYSGCPAIKGAPVCTCGSGRAA